jgi:outer membrane biosynthesis protein TonB
MAKKSGLSAEDVDSLRSQLDGGTQPLVWFTAAAVGMEAGRSAKLLAFTDPEEGDFIQVRPTGSKDEMSFSPAELTLEKPPPRKKPATPPPAPPEPPRETEIIHPYVPEAPVKPAAPKPKPAPVAAEPVAAPKPARKPAGSKNATPDVTVTVVSTGEGEWSVEVLQGTRKVVRPTPVPPAAMAQAAKLLAPEVAEIVDGVLNAARDRQLARVEQLRAELEAAQKALDDLGA